MKHKRNSRYYEKQNLVLSLLIAIPFFMIIVLIIPSREFQLGGTLISHVDTTEKVVALTFDDGPETPHSDEVLRILKEQDVRATFFLIGLEMERYPEATKRLATSGHEIGNHGFRHTSLVFMSERALAREIETTDQLIRSAGYDGEIPVRPPYGHKFVELPAYLAKYNRPTIMWSIAPDENGDASRDEIVERVLKNVSPGSIIILHAMYDHTTESRAALPALISSLKERGYRFVTVSELLKS